MLLRNVNTEVLKRLHDLLRINAALVEKKTNKTCIFQEPLYSQRPVNNYIVSLQKAITVIVLTITKKATSL